MREREPGGLDRCASWAQNSAQGSSSGTSTASWDARRLPIIGLTGNALKADQDAFLQGGADRVLTKPVNAEGVLLTLQELTRKLRQPANIALQVPQSGTQRGSASGR